MKVCRGCQVEKEESEFSKRSNTPDKLQYECKACQSAKFKLWMENNLEHNRKRSTEWKNKNPEKRKQQTKRYREKNKDKIRNRKRIDMRRRLNIDPLFRVIRILRNSLRHAIVNGNYKKRSSLTRLIGCTWPHLYRCVGPRPDETYHLDHIVPIAQAKSIEEVEKLFHYSNLQWLPGRENIQKSDSKTPEAEDLCKRLLGREWIE